MLTEIQKDDIAMVHDQTIDLIDSISKFITLHLVYPNKDLEPFKKQVIELKLCVIKKNKEMLESIKNNNHASAEKRYDNILQNSKIIIPELKLILENIDVYTNSRNKNEKYNIIQKLLKSIKRITLKIFNKKKNKDWRKFKSSGQVNAYKTNIIKSKDKIKNITDEIILFQ